MGEADRRRRLGIVGSGGGGGGAKVGDDIVEGNTPQMPICPLPLMNWRPPSIDVVSKDGQGFPVPALPCLGAQCMMYSEGVVQTDKGTMRRPMCNFGASAFALGQQVAPVIAQLGNLLADALAKHEAKLTEIIAQNFADALDEVFPADDENDDDGEPQNEIKPPVTLDAILPKTEV